MVFMSQLTLSKKTKSTAIDRKFEEVFGRTRGEKKWYLFVRRNGDSIVLDKTTQALTFEQSKYHQDHIGKGMPMVDVFTSDSEEDIQKTMKEIGAKYERQGIHVFKI